MVKGVLFDPDPLFATNPAWCSYPIFNAFVEIPRLGLKSTSAIGMLADTGSDATCLHLRDARPLLGEDGFNDLTDILTLRGVGGEAEYFREPAKIVLRHQSGADERFNIDILMVKPAKSKPKRKLQLQLPSILGRDVLCHFRFVLDYTASDVFLDHP